MLVTKQILADQIKLILSGGQASRDTELNDRHLMLAISQQFALAVKISLFQGKAEGDYDVSGGFIYSFEGEDGKGVEVKFDENKKMMYSEMPSPAISLPNEIGINHIAWMHSADRKFVRVPNNFMSLTRGRDIRGMQGEQVFYAENDSKGGGRIYYPLLEKKDCAEGKGILMKLVASISEIGEDYPINMSPDIQGQIIESVVKQYMPQIQITKDYKNDNSKIQGAKQ